jgi:hypothetical protein
MTRSSSASASPKKKEATPLVPAPTVAPPAAAQMSGSTDVSVGALIDLKQKINLTHDDKYRAPRPSYYYRLWTIRWDPSASAWGAWSDAKDFIGTYHEDQVPGTFYGTNTLSYWRSPADDMADFLASIAVVNDNPGFWYALRDQFDRSLDDSGALRTGVVASSGRFGPAIHAEVPDNVLSKKLGLVADGHVSEYLPGNAYAPETVIA